MWAPKQTAMPGRPRSGALAHCGQADRPGDLCRGTPEWMDIRYQIYDNII